MKTKIQAILMLVVLAVAGLSNGPHTPPINAPQNGGNPGPTCLPGGTNCQ